MQIDPSEIVRHMFDTLERLMDGVTPPERTMLVLPRLHRPKRRETRAV